MNSLDLKCFRKSFDQQTGVLLDPVAMFGLNLFFRNISSDKQHSLYHFDTNSLFF